MKSYIRAGFVVWLILSLPLVYFGTKKIKAEADMAHIEQTQGMFQVHHWLSPEGTKVAFTALPQLPMVDIHLAFNAGSAQDGDKFGNAQLVQQSLHAPPKPLHWVL